MSIHIKKIDNFTSFCGLDTVTQNNEFTDYNVIFANNGVGKTSTTRAFELLINKNNHILKYQTINNSSKPKISFLLNNNSIINIDDTMQVPSLSFKLEIYNSDFLLNNAPFGSEFGLKKLDDKTIILEGSVVGGESKEIEKLKAEIEIKNKRQFEINGDASNPDSIGEIDQLNFNNNELDRKIEIVRKEITSNLIQISKDDIKIYEKEFKDGILFSYDENKLFELNNQCDNLYEALKVFDFLDEINFPIFNFIQNKNKINELFIFDKEKEAGVVSDIIKEHILKVGTRFLQEGISIIENNLLETCPFCTQVIENNILNEYTNYFNEKLKLFDSATSEILNYLKNDKENLKNDKKNILIKFEKYKPFLGDDFEENKNNLNEFIDKLIDKINRLSEIVLLKEGITNQDLYNEIVIEIDNIIEKILNIINLTKNILEDKKTQKLKLEELKKDLKLIKILKGKKESFKLQKEKFDNFQKIYKLENEKNEIKTILEDLELKLQTLQSERRPEIAIINGYLKALNLSKYSINKDYKITINTSIVENDNLKIVLSEGEKTTITFAYFMARLKSYYNKATLKDLVIVIDDPISSLDENRIYNTSYMVSKINQEIAGEILKDNKDKAQVFVFTHSHIFMTNLIRILENHVNYYQLLRDDLRLELDLKNNVAGYFDTFFLMVFKDIYNFANESSSVENFDKAINNGNKIRILLESFIKTNFISEFIKPKFSEQKSFEEKVITQISNEIKKINPSHQFSNSIFKDNDYVIVNENDMYLKINKILKGLHMDSHGSVVDFYTQHKTSLQEIQGFAKIAINIMMALNPNQVHFYIEASK